MKLKKATALFLTLMLIILPSLGVYAETAVTEGTENANPAYSMTDNGETAKILVKQGASFILQRYKFDTTREELYTEALMKIIENHPELTEEAFKSMYSSLDEHSAYYTQDEYDYFLDSMSGQFSGIGVVITTISDGLLVTGVTKASPAASCGIKEGDIIISADGTDIKGMPIEQARAYIVGDIGTVVNIGIMRDGQYLEFNVERNTVTIEPGMYQIVNDSIGYIRLEEFDGSAPELVNNALDAFDAAGIRNVIFDVRSNPGGSVDVLLEICQRLIPEGPVIHFEYKNSLRNVSLYSECKNAKYNIIALANENSASAAEAFCGAVQDSGVGIVVGRKTYGKGTMQNITNFKTGGGVKLTEAEYLTRDKRHINGIGIEPDCFVQDSETTLKKSGYNDLDFETVLKKGDKGEYVLALNQRLFALGYDVGIPTDEYTDDTYYAVYNFQNSKGLYPYGVCDITTQLALENTLQEADIFDNASYYKAVEIFENNLFEGYKTKLSEREK